MAQRVEQPVTTPSDQFLRIAGRYFVFLTFKVTSSKNPAQKPRFAIASCFVVQIEGTWFLVTAGHVISDIESLRAGGEAVSNFLLQDKLAGTKYPPFHSNIRRISGS
jgi:hypothetical protein